MVPFLILFKWLASMAIKVLCPMGHFPCTRENATKARIITKVFRGAPRKTLVIIRALVAFSLVQGKCPMGHKTLIAILASHLNRIRNGTIHGTKL